MHVRAVYKYFCVHACPCSVHACLCSVHACPCSVQKCRHLHSVTATCCARSSTSETHLGHVAVRLKQIVPPSLCATWWIETARLVPACICVPSVYDACMLSTFRAASTHAYASGDMNCLVHMLLKLASERHVRDAAFPHPHRTSSIACNNMRLVPPQPCTCPCDF